MIVLGLPFRWSVFSRDPPGLAMSKWPLRHLEKGRRKICMELAAIRRGELPTHNHGMGAIRKSKSYMSKLASRRIMAHGSARAVSSSSSSVAEGPCIGPPYTPPCSCVQVRPSKAEPAGSVLPPAAGCQRRPQDARWAGQSASWNQRLMRSWRDYPTQYFPFQGSIHC
jgi:hypothetical protein